MSTFAINMWLEWSDGSSHLQNISVVSQYVILWTSEYLQSPCTILLLSGAARRTIAELAAPDTNAVTMYQYSYITLHFLPKTVTEDCILKCYMVD